MSGEILNDINLKQYSWFNLGGNAKNFLNQKIIVILLIF